MPDLINETHDPKLESWVDSANDPATDFPIQNLPFGIFSKKSTKQPGRPGVAIGDRIVDLQAAAKRGLIKGKAVKALQAETLNEFAALGPSAWSGVRRALSRGLRKGAKAQKEFARCLVKQSDVEMLLPVRVDNYTDFFVSLHHVKKVAAALNRPEPHVAPNWRWLPVAYHSRASTVIASGTPVRRPMGQYPEGGNAQPTFRRCDKLDYELEMAFIVGPGNARGTRIDIADAENHIFGLALMNDWSARDIQFWESRPLGPFLGKSLSTTLSPWIVTLEALAPFRADNEDRPAGDPTPLPYLTPPKGAAPQGFDITLEARILSAEAKKKKLSPTLFTHTSFLSMYWSVNQMLTHHASNGCALMPGDVIGTGTVSGPSQEESACLVERTLYGRDPVKLATGETRGFVEDGDDVIFTGRANARGYRSIGFGECRGVVTPAERI
jgi:fumarylacetoacetase